MNNITGIDVVDFILLNARGKCFVGWSRDEVAREVYEAIEEKVCAVSFDDASNITGVATGIILNPEKQLLRISNILTKKGSKDALRLLVSIFYRLYPNWSISGQKNKRERILGGDRFKTLVNSLNN